MADVPAPAVRSADCPQYRCRRVAAVGPERHARATLPTDPGVPKLRLLSELPPPATARAAHAASVAVSCSVVRIGVVARQRGDRVDAADNKRPQLRLHGIGPIRDAGRSAHCTQCARPGSCSARALARSRPRSRAAGGCICRPAPAMPQRWRRRVSLVRAISRIISW